MKTCFDKNNLPVIDNIDDLITVLCQLKYKFDVCPNYLTKKDFDLLLTTLDKSLFYLYREDPSIYTDVLFYGQANLTTNPNTNKENLNCKYPGIYLLNEPGNYVNFAKFGGGYVQVTESDLEDSILFAIPVFVLENNIRIFNGYKLVSYQLNVTIDGGEIGQ